MKVCQRLFEVLGEKVKRQKRPNAEARGVPCERKSMQVVWMERTLLKLTVEMDAQINNHPLFVQIR